MDKVKCPVHGKELTIKTETLTEGIDKVTHRFAVCQCDEKDKHWYGKTVWSSKSPQVTQTVQEKRAQDAASKLLDAESKYSK
jgi:uncharacterized Zn finger protein (UPF0148 family)